MAIRIDRLPISRINPAAYNPRKDLQPADPEYQRLLRSIERWDLVEPLVWNTRSGNLVGGHQRLKILQARGDSDVDVSVVDLDTDDEAALNVALNKISGEWDIPKLSDLLSELDANGFDATLTGFDLKELEGLLAPKSDGHGDPDSVPEVPAKPKSKLGEVYELGPHRLMCGNSISEEDRLAVLSGTRIDLVFADPPYGMDVETHYDQMFTADVQHRKTGPRFDRVIGDSAPFDPTELFQCFDDVAEQFWWGADYYCNHLPSGGSWVVWDKRGNESGMNLDAVAGSCFELCWSRQKHKRDIARILWSGHHGMQGDDTKKRVHPTQKPVTLVTWFLDRWGGNAKALCDPFGGSGTTLIAAEQLGRTCYMMELDPGYCDVIRKRYADFVGKPEYAP